MSIKPLARYCHHCLCCQILAAFEQVCSSFRCLLPVSANSLLTCWTLAYTENVRNVAISKGLVLVGPWKPWHTGPSALTCCFPWSCQWLLWSEKSPWNSKFHTPANQPGIFCSRKPMQDLARQEPVQVAFILGPVLVIRVPNIYIYILYI